MDWRYCGDCKKWLSTCKETTTPFKSKCKDYEEAEESQGSYMDVITKEWIKCFIDIPTKSETVMLLNNGSTIALIGNELGVGCGTEHIAPNPSTYFEQFYKERRKKLKHRKITKYK